MSIQMFGLPVSRGVTIGRAVLVAASRVDVPHFFIEADKVDQEVSRLLQARDRVAEELAGLRAELPTDAPAELDALLDVHLLLVQDEHLVEAATRWVVERRYNAAWALAAQLEVLARQFDEMDDAYLRDRKTDLEQVAERVLATLVPGAHSGPGARLEAVSVSAAQDGEPLVLVAPDISPADMLAFRRSVFAGFVTDLGGQASHTAIVARSMDIPAVVAARDASRVVRQDDRIIVDGDAGLIVVDPPPIVLEEYRFRQRQGELDRERLSRLRHTPAVTLDATSIELLANIELPADTQAAVDAGAMGVGLFRTEFLFMNRGGQLPGEDEQYEAYRAVVTGMGGRPVTIRTVDVGADKPLDRDPSAELRQEHSLNPALGLRAIRWSLADPPMFRQQLRAILRASAHGPVNLLLPMVSHASQMRAVVDQLSRARAQLQDAGRLFGSVPLGAMVEVPAAAVALERLLPWIDFVSIGTNDLIQYTLAIDRADDTVSHLYDPWHPAVLELLRRTVQVCTAAGKPVSVCGELAGDPAFAGLLLGLGLTSLSMHPARIGLVKQAVLRCDVARLRSEVPAVLADDDPRGLSARIWRHLTDRAGSP
jgi:phosphoenolpyruvate-protein phosphotransferase (PTS system enzyme I)